MELVHTTKGLIAHSPKASIVTVSSLAVAATCLGLLLGGVGSAGSRPAVGSAPTAPVLAGPGSRSRALPSQEYVAQIERMTPVQRIEAFGTNQDAAAVVASLTPAERLYVESIMTMTPSQLRAAFGTAGGH
jgi:hypothetical protein